MKRCSLVDCFRTITVYFENKSPLLLKLLITEDFRSQTENEGVFD